MSYFQKIEYQIIPADSFAVTRNCSGCGRKAHFINTKKFRVNANGNKLDVWLIYQCENCKHTLNLTIYERQKISSIPKAIYKRFVENEEQLAEQYGKDFSLFQKNKAEIDIEQLQFQFIPLDNTIPTDDFDCKENKIIKIHNPFSLKIRPEKQISALFRLSRSQVQKQINEGSIQLQQISPQCISFYFKK